MIYLCRFYGLDEVANYWEQVILLNEWQKKRISKLIIETFYGTVSSKKISLLGFSFKSNTNDTRESPAIKIAADLLENGADINWIVKTPAKFKGCTALDILNHPAAPPNVKERAIPFLLKHGAKTAEQLKAAGN